MTNDEDLAQLVESAHALSRTLRRTGEQDVGLPPLPASEFDVLQYVVTHPEPSVSEVARALRLQTSNVSTTVRALQERGLVEKVADPADQRRSLLRVSARAREHRGMLGEAWARTLRTALEDLPAADVVALRAALPALSALAEAVVRNA